MLSCSSKKNYMFVLRNSTNLMAELVKIVIFWKSKKINTHPKYHLRQVVRQRWIQPTGSFSQQYRHFAGKGDEHGIYEQEDGFCDGEIQQTLHVLDVPLIQYFEMAYVRDRYYESDELGNKKNILTNETLKPRLLKAHALVGTFLCSYIDVCDSLNFLIDDWNHNSVHLFGRRRTKRDPCYIMGWTFSGYLFSQTWLELWPQKLRKMIEC